MASEDLRDDLFAACRGGDLEGAQFCLDCGTDLAVEDNRAFQFATQLNQLSILLWLLENGVSFVDCAASLHIRDVRRLAVEIYGLNPAPFPRKLELAEACEEVGPRNAALLKSLEAENITLSDVERRTCLQSTVCRKLVASGLLRSREDLLAILSANPKRQRKGTVTRNQRL